MASTGLFSLDQLLGTDGYPDRSTNSDHRPPGIGKEALGCWFTHSGLVQNDFCLYTTRLSTREVLQDVKAFNVDFSQRVRPTSQGHIPLEESQARRLGNCYSYACFLITQYPGIPSLQNAIPAEVSNQLLSLGFPVMALAAIVPGIPVLNSLPRGDPEILLFGGAWNGLESSCFSWLGSLGAHLSQLQIMPP